ncbi:MAG: peptidase domain-containing ABC transporter [Vicinamibacterales bacterium]
MHTPSPDQAVPPRDLVPTIRYLASVHATGLDAATLDAAIRRLERHGRVHPLDGMRRLAAEAGLTLAIVHRPLADVVADAAPAFPWVALRVTPDGRCESIAVVERRFGGAAVVVPDATATPARWSLEGLRRWLGAHDTRTAVPWILAEPAGPLSQLRTPDGKPRLTPGARLRALLDREGQTLRVAIVYSVVIGLLSLVVPVAVQALVNNIAFGAALQPLVVLTLFVLVALGFSTAMNAFRAGAVEIIQRSLFARVATDVTHRLLRVRADAFDHYHGPELVNRFFDVVTVQKSASLLLIDGLSILMQTVIGMVLLAVYHPWLLAFDVLMIAAMLVIIFVLGRGAIDTAIKESKAKYALEGWLEQIAAHLVTFKSAGGTEYAVRRSHDLLESYLHYRGQHFTILLRQIIASFGLQALASAALLGIGGWLVIERQLTLGQLVASELVVTAMVSAFTKFGKQLEVFYDLAAAIDKLGDLVDLPLERQGGEAVLPTDRPAAVTLREIDVRYEAERPALQLTACVIQPGERLGLSGPNGSGKSTLADVLYGLRLPTAGLVQIDGNDLRAIPLTQLRQHVALVRHVELFPGSIVDNVRLGREGVSLDQVTAALKAVGLLDELLGLPDGLDSQLHAHGRPLSNRQAGRLMIARAIVGRPRLLILDGALDQIDRQRERDELTALLFEPSAPWTLVCITERPDLLARCSRVVVLQDGVATETPLEDLAS